MPLPTPLLPPLLLLLLLAAASAASADPLAAFRPVPIYVDNNINNPWLSPPPPLSPLPPPPPPQLAEEESPLARSQAVLGAQATLSAYQYEPSFFHYGSVYDGQQGSSYSAPAAVTAVAVQGSSTSSSSSASASASSSYPTTSQQQNDYLAATLRAWRGRDLTRASLPLFSLHRSGG